MSAYKWISTGLKNLRISPGSATTTTGLGVQGTPQARQASTKALPEPPKKPLTAYFRYVATFRPKIVKENPNLKVTEVVRLLSQQWATLPDPEKAAYVNEYRAEKENYDKISQKFKDSLTNEQKDEIQKIKLDKKIKKESRVRKHKLKELGRPKRPRSAFMRYLNEHMSKNMSKEQLTKEVKGWAERWNTLPEEEKKPYQDAAQKEAATHQIQLKKWEEKMLQLGHEDVVRQTTLKEKTTPKEKKAKK